MSFDGDDYCKKGYEKNFIFPNTILDMKNIQFMNDTLKRTKP